MSTSSGTTGWIVKGLLSLGLVTALALTLNSLAFSDASFTAGSSNFAAFTAGTLGHFNDRNGLFVIDAAGLVPGDVRSGRMSLTGLGDLPGRYTLSAAGLVDSPVSPRLSDALDMLVADESNGSSLYEGPVSGFSSADLGTIGPGDTRSYSVTLSYPDGVSEADLQGATMTLTLRVLGVTS